MPRKFAIVVTTAAALWMVALITVTAQGAGDARSTELTQPAPVTVSTL